MSLDQMWRIRASFQLFASRDALEDQQNDGDEQNAVHDGQQDEPVGVLSTVAAMAMLFAWV